MGLLLGLAVIPVAYYTYTGVFGVNADWVNITIFFLAAGLVFWVETKLFEREYTCRMQSGPALLLIGLIAVLFTVLTFKPPHIPLFQDPVTQHYGYQ